jgi:D-arabinose 1-dehydrogenase-like Zn-dependent alcohol dehydrogenase
MLAVAINLIELPEDLSFATDAAIPCGASSAFGALRRLDDSGNETIAVVGQVPVGLFDTQLAKAMGAPGIALDISPEHLARLKALGADDVVKPAEI